MPGMMKMKDKNKKMMGGGMSTAGMGMVKKYAKGGMSVANYAKGGMAKCGASNPPSGKTSKK